MSATYTTAHGNTGSLTHRARPGIEPETSWFLVRFVSAESQQELPTPNSLSRMCLLCACIVPGSKPHHVSTSLVLPAGSVQTCVLRGGFVSSSAFPQLVVPFPFGGKNSFFPNVPVKTSGKNHGIPSVA
uniref:Uncharacterized protein n=1 Tax=Sus scrofa TaxID=9823 RepID=A0A4X1UAF3_PIG